MRTADDANQKTPAAPAATVRNSAGPTVVTVSGGTGRPQFDITDLPTFDRDLSFLAGIAYGGAASTN